MRTGRVCTVDVDEGGDVSVFGENVSGEIGGGCVAGCALRIRHEGRTEKQGECGGRKNFICLCLGSRGRR